MGLSTVVKFARENLQVAYRASPEPQKLRIRVELERKRTDDRAGHHVDGLLFNVEHGIAGGPAFHPAKCSIKLLSGPRKKTDKGIAGPKFEWKLEVAGIAPKYTRSIVEHFATIGGMVSVVRMAIEGSLAADESASTVTTAKVKKWLSDPTEFVDAWPEPPFEIKETKAKKTAAVRVVLASPITPAQKTELDALRQAFDGEHIFYRTSKDELANIWGDVKTAYQGAEMKFGYDKFQVAAGPPRNAMINLVTRFHERVAKVAALELALPAG
jgi:hypothetical protein